MRKSAAVVGAAARWVHRSADEWNALVQAHASSGLTQAAFCEREGISTMSLSTWRKRLGACKTAAAQAQFVEVKEMQRPLDVGVSVRLELGGGIVLTIERS